METRSTARLVEGAPRPVRVLGAVLLAVALVAFSGSSALAQPPGNDDRGGAKVVSSVPYEDVVDTTEATSQAIDPCTYEDERFRTVWYSFTPAEDARYAARAQFDDPDHLVIIAVAIPAGGGDLDIINCDWGSQIVWQGEAGQEYLVMAGPWSGSPSGKLRFSIVRTPGDPWVRLSVADSGRVGRLGSAIISGRVRCPASADRAYLSVRVRQDFRRFIVIGNGRTRATCGDRWTARAQNYLLRFARGEATVRASASVCNDFGCSRKRISRTVILR
jgi:hypothetical protein